MPKNCNGKEHRSEKSENFMKPYKLCAFNNSFRQVELNITLSANSLESIKSPIYEPLPHSTFHETWNACVFSSQHSIDMEPFMCVSVCVF